MNIRKLCKTFWVYAADLEEAIHDVYCCAHHSVCGNNDFDFDWFEEYINELVHLR